jgi:23S rRNA pseudouridine1911/1915/1917 synthase
VHGLVNHGAAGGPAERPGIVHRLDQHTSGLLVVARSAKAHRRLSESIAAREVKREYVALVKGRPLSWEGRIDAPIGRDRGDASRQSLDTNAPREAMTHFVVEELIGPRARLKVELGTGRTHQIRVHLAAIDLPICGDPTYGVADDLGLSRQFLHAARLVLEHPFTADELDVSSPLPDDLSHALDDARRAQPTQDRLEGAPATVG